MAEDPLLSRSHNRFHQGNSEIDIENPFLLPQQIAAQDFGIFDFGMLRLYILPFLFELARTRKNEITEETKENSKKVQA